MIGRMVLRVVVLAVSIAVGALVSACVRDTFAADPTATLLSDIRRTRGDGIASDPTLDAIARRRSAEIVTRWSHEGAGAPWPWGENLAWTTEAADPAGWIVQAWLDSPGHRVVLLGDWSHVGIGATYDPGTGRWYVAAVFARIPATAAVPAPGPRPATTPRPRPAVTVTTPAPTPSPRPALVWRHPAARLRAMPC